MVAVEIITAEIEKRKLSQQAAAKLCGMTRQRLWDVLEKRNPRFCTMEKIMGGFGYEVALIDKATGEEIQNQEAEMFVRQCSSENVAYDSIVRILDTLGYVVTLKKTHSSDL